ncbi:MAG: AraC family transcriptional regulator [Pseudomonadota bacterium]
MSDTGFITRTQMADAMRTQFNSELSETFAHNWKRTNTLVIDQGDTEIKDSGVAFHLLEVCLEGSHLLESSYESEHGDHFRGATLPGSVGYYHFGPVHYLNATGRAKLQQICIADNIFRQTAESILRGDPDTGRPLSFQGVFEPELKRLATMLLEEARCPAIGTDLRADLISQDIALLLFRRRDAARIKLPATLQLSAAQLTRVMAYLEDQIEDIGGMDTLASLIDMDVYSFTKAFKATTGESPGQFLIQRRLARVKDLLRNSDDSLADITYATGFSNQPHMTATFTKHVGTSPGKWRKAVRA